LNCDAGAVLQLPSAKAGSVIGMANAEMAIKRCIMELRSGEVDLGCVGVSLE
jgi:hypothetical protein